MIKEGRRKRASQGQEKKQQKVVGFVTFESELAPLGGLAAVMRVLPQSFSRLNGWSSFILTPFFRSITQCQKEKYQAIQPTDHQYTVSYGNASHTVEVFRYHDKHGFDTFLIDSQEFFNAPCDCGQTLNLRTPCNPYLNPDNPNQLLEDSLFFCAAVPKALIALGYTDGLTVSLQDWETAAVALTLLDDSQLSSVSCVLTLHNSYDKEVTEREIQRISTRTVPGSTILSKVIPLLDTPLCTVSENFAYELVNEPVQTQVYAPHLQSGFAKNKIVGINNGSFGKSEVPDCAMDQEKVQVILEKKQKNRSAMINVLEDYRPARAWGKLDWHEFDGPVFLCLGRDDPRQKGYDVAVAAIQRIPRGKAKYIFTPIPGDEGIQGLGFLMALAEERLGEVKAFPFRMANGFLDLQRGASFIVMCSLYEPFGAATEAYAVGTPVVARATGGLVQQVVSYPSLCCTESVRHMASRFHDRASPPTGFLFREPELSPDDLESGWRAILNCAYFPNEDRLQERLNIPLFQAMVQSATQAFLDAIEVYVHEQTAYAHMIDNGFQMLDQFSWDTAARKYASVFQTAGPPRHMT